MEKWEEEGWKEKEFLDCAVHDRSTSSALKTANVNHFAIKIGSEYEIKFNKLDVDYII